jgi:hypothetical protein
MTQPSAAEELFGEGRAIEGYHSCPWTPGAGNGTVQTCSFVRGGFISTKFSFLARLFVELPDEDKRVI